MITEALVTAAAGGVITEHLLGGLITDSLSKFLELVNYHLCNLKLDHQNPLDLFYKYCHYPDCWQIFVCLNDSFC